MFVSNPGNVTLSDYDTQTLTDKLNVDDILQSRDYFNQTDFDSTGGTSGFGAGNLASGAGGANVAQPLKSTYTKSDDFGQMHSYGEGLLRGNLTETIDGSEGDDGARRYRDSLDKSGALGDDLLGDSCDVDAGGKAIHMPVRIPTSGNLSNESDEDDVSEM